MAVLASVGVNAAKFTWTSDDGQYTVTASNVGDETQKLEVNKEGALAAFVKATKDLSDSEGGSLKGVGGNSQRVNLIVEGPMGADDFTAMNSSTVSRWGNFKNIDLSSATISGIGDMGEMNLSGLEYLRLPNGLTSADDVTKMATLKNSSKNNNLKVVGSYDPTHSPVSELALHSFEANKVQTFRDKLMYSGEYNAKSIRMSGIFGGLDLVTELTGYNRVFTGSPALWDFSNAVFEACTVPGPMTFANGSKYYDDPFEEEHSPYKTELSNFQTNAFFYFSAYPKDVVDITLPQTMTELPPFCLQQLATANVENYKLVSGKTDEEIAELYPNASGKGVPIPNLVIPNSVVTIGYECAYNTSIQNITFGTGLKEVQGGAFKQVNYLSDIEFTPGISNCVLGHDAFQLCYDVKHVVLCEGIVSLGAGCFQNSQQMESIRLPETLEYIGNRCFDNNLALGSITIPSNVDKIGKQAFRLTAITDVYLTTTDPAKIPAIYTAGTSWGDINATFGINQLYGNNGTPDPQLIKNHAVSSMTWDDAAVWYYTHANGIVTLHFPTPLANKVMSFISEDYDGKSTDNYGLPSQRDAAKRANGLGEVNLGTAGNNGGRFTRDGWVQFLLMKEYKTSGETKVYTKEYDDVWNTMCFPFDLTDEQLATAFNEGFNIVDFSGVEIKEPEDTPENKKTLILHFNTVALTTYKDIDGNVYERIGREPQQQGTVTFDYNIYRRNGVEYHHVITASGDAASTKTKTFGPGTSLADAAANYQQNKEAVFIDGYLASAGHPYMIHPNVGVSPGQPKVACHMVGITWEPVENRDNLFDSRKRTIDLGVAMHDDSDENKPDADNYLQRAYSDYSGQTYTFKGNWKAYNDVAEVEEEPQLTAIRPYPPVEPRQEPDEVINPGPNPGEPSQAVQEAIATYTSSDIALYDVLRKDIWPEETNITCEYGDANNQQWASYNQLGWKLQGHPEWGNPYGSEDDKRSLFNKCKSIFNNMKQADKYITWLRRNDNYKTYLEEKAYWDQWQADGGAAAWQEYQEALNAYNQAVEEYEAALQTWKNNLAAQGGLILIPKDAYFLGRRDNEYPKYYRETSTNTSRTTGLWSQYTAIVMPNDAAVAGIEAELDGKKASANGFNMVIDENFTAEMVTPTQIKQIVAEAEENGEKVEYMKVVYNINGQVVREGDTSLEGLPKGIYIVNGKKYFVR